MGIINTDPAVRLNATFSPVYPPEGRVAMSTQSGALGLAILDYAARLNIGFSTFASIGNKADVSGNDLIQYWADDPRTDVILLYVESFGNPRTFSELARDIGRHKPIVAVKAGRSAAGARAASSHTGALASSDVIVEALFRQAGVIRTYTLEEMFDVAALLAHQPVPNGRRVAILTNAGGPGNPRRRRVRGERSRAAGAEPDTRARRCTSFFQQPRASATRSTCSHPRRPSTTRRPRASCSPTTRVDSLLTIFIPPLVTDPKAVAEAIVRGASGARKPVLATFMSAQGAPSELQTIPCYMFPEAAATALARVVTHGEWRRRPRGTVPVFPDVRPDDARDVIDRAQGWLSPADVHAVLNAFGIDAMTLVPAASEDEAVAAARGIGLPVAMKAVGPAIVHKTDLGGIALGLAGDDAVRTAYRDMSRRLGSAMSGVDDPGHGDRRCRDAGWRDGRPELWPRHRVRHGWNARRAVLRRRCPPASAY